MKRMFVILSLFISTIAIATPSDDLRHAIIMSNLKEVLQLLPSVSEKASFIQLADEILNKRYVDYEAHRVVPQISFPMAFCFAAGLTAYLACMRKFNAYGLNSKFISLSKFGLEILQAMLTNPEICKNLPIEGPIDLAPVSETLNQAEKRLNIAHILSKVGIAAGAGLLATSAWLGFRNMQNLHDLYMNALEIKYALTTAETSVPAVM